MYSNKYQVKCSVKNKSLKQIIGANTIRDNQLLKFKRNATKRECIPLQCLSCKQIVAITRLGSTQTTKTFHRYHEISVKSNQGIAYLNLLGATMQSLY